jgi:hypothetical protein
MSIQSPVYGRCGRIGLIVPANNSVIEPEFWSVLPPGVAAYGTRVERLSSGQPSSVFRPLGEDLEYDDAEDDHRSDTVAI